MFSTIVSIFVSKKAREAEASAKLKEEERKARLARNMPPQRNPSSSYADDSGLWSVPLNTYPSNYNIAAREVESPSNFLSEGSGSFSGAGSSSSWSSSSSDDSSSRSCSSSSDSYSSSDSSSSCSSSD